MPKVRSFAGYPNQSFPAHQGFRRRQTHLRSRNLPVRWPQAQHRKLRPSHLLPHRMRPLRRPQQHPSRFGRRHPQPLLPSLPRHWRPQRRHLWLPLRRLAPFQQPPAWLQVPPLAVSPAPLAQDPHLECSSHPIASRPQPQLQQKPPQPPLRSNLETSSRSF